MYLSAVGDVDPSDVDTAFQKLENEGREHLSHEGVTEDNMFFQRHIDMRYLGQWRAMSIEVGEKITSLDDAVALFHEEHGREHNYSRLDAPVEIYRLTVTATGNTPKAEFALHELDSATPEPFDKRDVVFDEDPQAIMTPIYNRDNLKAGAIVEGPAIIEQLDSTILVPPGLKAKVESSLTIVIDVPLAQG
jgi:N-methylhydantoinase A